jgi:hypothetical protein
LFVLTKKIVGCRSIGARFVFARRLDGWLAVLTEVVPRTSSGNPSGTVLLYAVATSGWLWTSAVPPRPRASSTWSARSAGV